MKKRLLFVVLILFCLLIVEGCKKLGDIEEEIVENTTKTMKCTFGEIDEYGLLVNETVTLTYDDEKVLTMKSTRVVQTYEDLMDLQIQYAKNVSNKINEVDGINIKIEKIGNEKIATTTNIDYERIDVEKLNSVLSESFGTTDEKNMYNAANLSVEDYQGLILDGYTCE